MDADASHTFREGHDLEVQRQEISAARAAVATGLVIVTRSTGPLK
jgi:hypothetical protein